MKNEILNILKAEVKDADIWPSEEKEIWVDAELSGGRAMTAVLKVSDYTRVHRSPSRDIPDDVESTRYWRAVKIETFDKEGDADGIEWGVRDFKGEI